jgi:hypothetical protein
MLIADIHGDFIEVAPPWEDTFPTASERALGGSRFSPLDGRPRSSTFAEPE